MKKVFGLCVCVCVCDVRYGYDGSVEYHYEAISRLLHSYPNDSLKKKNTQKTRTYLTASYVVGMTYLYMNTFCYCILSICRFIVSLCDGMLVCTD